MKNSSQDLFAEWTNQIRQSFIFFWKNVLVPVNVFCLWKNFQVFVQYVCKYFHTIILALDKACFFFFFYIHKV